VLDLAADAEQMRVVPGEPDDVPIRPAIDRDQEVAIRDPAAERDEMELGVAELRDPSKRRGELLAQLASQFFRFSADRRLGVRDGQAITASPVARSASTWSTFRPWPVAT
jgi:hypothetical protein